MKKHYFRNAQEADKQKREKIAKYQKDKNTYNIFSALPDESIYPYIGQYVDLRLFNKTFRHEILHAGYDVFCGRYIIVKRSNEEVEVTLKLVSDFATKHNENIKLEEVNER